MFFKRNLKQMKNAEIIKQPIVLMKKIKLYDKGKDVNIHDTLQK